MKFQGRSLPKIGPIWKQFAVMGLTANAIPFVLLSWGQQYLDSALAAILVGTTPLFTMLSVVTYLNPVIATILGVVILHEHLGWHAYLSYAMIILGIIIANGVFQMKIQTKRRVEFVHISK